MSAEEKGLAEKPPAPETPGTAVATPPAPPKEPVSRYPNPLIHRYLIMSMMIWISIETPMVVVT